MDWLDDEDLDEYNQLVGAINPPPTIIFEEDVVLLKYDVTTIRNESIGDMWYDLSAVYDLIEFLEERDFVIDLEISGLL